MWFTKNAIKRKNLMAITGLFLSFFLIIHLMGNLQLLFPEAEAKLQYNAYSNFLGNSSIVILVSYVLYLSIFFHSVDAVYLLLKRRKANGAPYKKDRRGRASKWYSRHMMALGVIVFVFLVIHFKDFWYAYKFGDLPLDKNGNRDLYSLVVASFRELWYVILYVIAIVALGYHLLHGVFSAHRSLGVYHPVLDRIVKGMSAAFAIGISLGYIIIPVFIYLRQYL